jgi:excisionase family DNA binding protein
MSKQKDVLTTGEVAKICSVAPRTVSKWFDSGQLRGYRIPGSKDRRIPLAQLIRFMQTHGMPLNGLDGATTRVLIVDSNVEATELLSTSLSNDPRFDLRTAECGFDSGIIAEQFRPHVVLVDVMLEDISIKKICQVLKQNPELQGTRIVAITSPLTEGESQALLQQGIDGILTRPFEVPEVVQAIDESLSIIH